MDLLTALRSRLGSVMVVPLAYWESGDDRGGARVHVGPTSVLVGPWTTSPTLEVCGACVHARWLRVRSTSERSLRAAIAPMVGSGDGSGAGGRVWPMQIAFVVDAAEMLLRSVQDETDPPQSPPAPDGCAYLTAIDVDTLHTQTTLVEREPLCPVCSTWVPDTPPLTTIHRRPTPGGSRVAPVEDYELSESALINVQAGVLGSTATEDVGSPTIAPVFGRFDSRAARGSSELTWSGQTVSYARSRLVGLLEGLERYGGSVRRRPVRPVMAPFTEVASEAIDPRVVGLYAPQVYATEPGLVPFDVDLPIPWVWGYSLRDRRPVLVAQRNVFYGSVPGPDRFVDECSNGCASGGCLEEAIVHGLLEVIERDAFLLAWYGGRRMERIDLRGTQAGLAADRLTSRAALLGYHVDLLDTTSDVGVPVVTALATRVDGGDGLLVLAAGASLDPEEAATSALGEVLTYLPGRAHQTRRRRTELEAMVRDYTQVRSLRDHAELFGLPAMGRLGMDLRGDGPPLPASVAFAGARPWSGDLAVDLGRMVATLADLGHDVVAVDETSPEQARRGVNAVRVVVPGLLPIDFGWSHQRALRMPRLLGAAGSSEPSAIRHVPHPFP
ncbi:MAG: TOMM precursor leader peptide-binding protein [Humibacillus sp.]|nr:TOMM precursor leader peptide-binding protein [Humibacillus sp.]